MRRKLIFFDIDGTILGRNGMSESTRRAIEETRRNGHFCVINTGRTKKLVGPDIRGLTEFDGFVMGCGTMVEYHGRELYHRVIPEEEGLRIIDGLRRHHIDAVLEGKENNYRDTKERIFSEVFRHFILHFRKEGYGSYEEAPGHFDKFYGYAADPGDMRGFAEESAGKLGIIDREGGWYEVVPCGITKATGMKRLADALGIPPEDTAAVGDGPNDVTMLRGAGTAIVMGNAPAEVKALADFVTAGVDDDGIEKAMSWLGVL